MLIATILGWISGVGLNLLADDLPARTSDAPDRFIRPIHSPTCAYCGRVFPLWQWSGLAAFLLRRGHCPHCIAPRPLRPALVELVLAVCFAFLWRADSTLLPFLASAIVLWIMLLIAVIDLEHRLVLNVVSLPAAMILLPVGVFVAGRGWGRTAIGGAVGFGVVGAIYLLGLGFSWWMARVRRQPLDEVAFGWGDVMLGGVIGLLTGWSGVIAALTIAVFAAGLAGAGILLVQVFRRRYSPYTAIPYGPFLVLGALVVYFGNGPLRVWLTGLLAR